MRTKTPLQRAACSGRGHHPFAMAVAMALAALIWPTVAPAQDFLKTLRDLGKSATAATEAASATPTTAPTTAPTPTPAPATEGAPRTARKPALSASDAARASLDPLNPSKAALAELQPDAKCLEVAENVDVLQKAADYGGTAAQLRLQALVASNFTQSDLTQSDKDLLKYLAYTTVWIPSSVEVAVGKAWAAVSSKGGDTAEPSGRSQRKALDRQAERLDQMRGLFDAFPGNAIVLLDPTLPDGAFSRVGGMVVLSPRFLSMMDQKDGARDVLLAHELSHIYKRHALKALQYDLVGSVKGWNITKRLLSRALAKGSTSSTNGIGGLIQNTKDTIENIGVAKDVVEFIKENQTRYSVDQEFEADACAIRLLAKLSIEPAQAWRAFSEVLQDPGPVPAAAYASVHPSPKQRDENIAVVLQHPLDLPPTAAGPNARKTQLTK